jgi:DNA-directed RNA polymerase subunit RPC12/RpoP
MKVEYKFNDCGPVHSEEVEQTELHCPECGQKTVYVEVGDGDYYQGPTYYCKSCKNEFTMPSSGVRPNLKFIE